MVPLFFLLLFFTRHALSQDPTYLKIDCGGDDNVVTGWVSDAGFITAGENSPVEANSDLSQMNTLRYFPDQNKNCYTLPATAAAKYLVRAGFYYGNYDGKSRGPGFDLQLEGNLWASVDASAGEKPFVYETIVVAKVESISVCVARTKEGDVPFISTLETVELAPGMYKHMEKETALFMKYRLNFGYDQAVWWPLDPYARIWYPAEYSNYTNMIAPMPTDTLDDRPPWIALTYAIEGSSTSSPLSLSFDLSRLPRPKYVNLYFTEPQYLIQDTRSFDIFFNGENVNMTLSPRFQKSDEVYIVTEPIAGPITLELRATENSTLPPVISAMEIFAVSGTLVEGTADDDVSGLTKLTSNLWRLRSWTGDPCLPSNTPWEWLKCNKDNRPRVTALYLAGYGLQGSLPDFSEMDALEIIDLHNNSLTGSIPDFLGRLPNLKELNIADNNFDGGLPDSLVNNNRVSVNVSGNPEMRNSGKGKTALIAGLAAGGGALFLLVCIVAAIWLSKLRRKPKPEAAENGGNQANTPTAPQINQTSVELSGHPYEEHVQPESGDHTIPVNLHPDEELYADLQMQMESELDDLFEQQGQVAAGGSHTRV